MRITSDGGGNIRVYRESLETNYTNDYVYPPPNPLFTMNFIAHILEGDCKSGVKLIKSDDGKVDTKLTKQNMQKFIF